jgi:hypothetical protein
MELKVGVSEAIVLIKEGRRGGSPIKILYQVAFKKGMKMPRNTRVEVLGRAKRVGGGGSGKTLRECKIEN